MDKAEGWVEKCEEMRQLAEDMEDIREVDEGARRLRRDAPFVLIAIG